ncbi:hypothetical protein HN588_15795 [Candidatus Bathyarchaeota archaeon]|jgi:hypothetical protein|nr:hypothetical protein [Candidatus Bathyarchaeota archaeon]
MGGWKSVRTVGVKLDPATVQAAINVFLNVLTGFNAHLAANGKMPVEPQRPVGSVSYHQDDAENSPDKVYGDIDYLVSFPCTQEDDATSRRKIENSVKRDYQGLWISYLQTQAPPEVDVGATTGSSPWLVIINLPDGRAVQVDIIITFPKYCKWMGGRYEPERGKKGLIMGHLYKALGDALTLSIGTEGVIARTRAGQRVPSKYRKGVTLDTVSTDIDNFLIDIAKYLTGAEELQLHPDLQQNPGVSAGGVTLDGLATGIRGLGHTLAAAGEASSAQDFADEVLSNYRANMAKELENPKYKKADTPEQFAVIDKIAKQIKDAVEQVEGILQGRRTESVLRHFIRESLRS